MIYDVRITEHWTREGRVSLEADSRQDAVRKVRRAVKDNCLAVMDFGRPVKGRTRVHRDAQPSGIIG